MPETDLHSWSKQIVSFMKIRMKVALFSIFGISYSIVALLVFLKRQCLSNFKMVSPKRSTKKPIFSQWFRIANVAKDFKNYKRKKWFLLKNWVIYLLIFMQISLKHEKGLIHIFTASVTANFTIWFLRTVVE